MRSVVYGMAVLILCVASMGAGYIFGGSNLGYGGYPDFDEMQPDKPWDRDEFSAGRYRDEVEEYVNNAKEYVENAKNDIKRINAGIEDAIEKANAAVEEHNPGLTHEIQFSH